MLSAIRLPYRYADVLATAWFLVLTYASLSPLPELPAITENDKLLHAIAYASLVMLAIVRRKSTRNAMILTILIIAYGGVIELLQPYVNRYGEIGDFVANTVGAVAGALVIAGLHKLAFRRAG